MAHVKNIKLLIVFSFYFLIIGCQSKWIIRESVPEELSLVNKRGFYCFFNDGFSNDTISISINGVNIFDRKILISNDYGVVDPKAEVKFDGDTLKIRIDNTESSRLNFTATDKVNIHILKNKNEVKIFSFLLKKGQFFVINNALVRKEVNANLEYYREIRMLQYKRIPVYE